MLIAPPIPGKTASGVGSAVSVGMLVEVGGFCVSVAGMVAVAAGCGVEVEASVVAVNLGYPQIATPIKATRMNSIPRRIRDLV